MEADSDMIPRIVTVGTVLLALVAFSAAPADAAKSKKPPRPKTGAWKGVWTYDGVHQDPVFLNVLREGKRKRVVTVESFARVDCDPSFDPIVSPFGVPLRFFPAEVKRARFHSVDTQVDQFGGEETLVLRGRFKSKTKVKGTISYTRSFAAGEGVFYDLGPPNPQTVCFRGLGTAF